MAYNGHRQPGTIYADRHKQNELHPNVRSLGHLHLLHFLDAHSMEIIVGNRHNLLEGIHHSQILQVWHLDVFHAVGNLVPVESVPFQLG
jgi:hypothetical protein